MADKVKAKWKTFGSVKKSQYGDDQFYIQLKKGVEIRIDGEVISAKSLNLFPFDVDRLQESVNAGKLDQEVADEIASNTQFDVCVNVAKK